MNKQLLSKIILIIFILCAITFIAMILDLKDDFAIAISLYIIPVAFAAYFWQLRGGAIIALISEATLTLVVLITHPETFSSSMINLEIIFLIFALIICRLFSMQSKLKLEHSRFLAQEAKFRALFKAVPDAIVIIDPEQKIIIDANLAAEELLGITEESLAGKNCYDYICFSNGRICDHQEINSGVFRTEETLKTKTGNSISVLRSIKRIVIDNKDYIVGSFNDVSELKKSQQMLETSNNKYINLFNNIPLPMCRAEIKGKLVDVNNAFLNIMKITDTKTFSDFLFEDFFEDEIEKEYFISLLNKDELVNNMELKFRRADNSSFHALATAHLVTELNGKTLIEGSIIDISAIKELEDKQKELEKLTNRNLHMDSITNLAAGMAHDINNILAGIHGHAQVIRYKLKDSSLDENLNRIAQGVEKADSILQGLLTSIGSYSYNPETIELNSFMSSVLKEFEGKYIGNDRYNFFEADEKILVEMDPILIKEMILEIIKNAIKASMNNKKILITTGREKPENVICSFSEAEPSTSAFISITDTGRGIDEKNINRIFEPYFTTEDFGNGAGIGLTKVYGIVQRHKGAIGIKTDRKTGTSVSIYFKSDIKN